MTRVAAALIYGLTITLAGCLGASTSVDRDSDSGGEALRARMVDTALAEWRSWGGQRHGGGVYRRGGREGEPELDERVRRYYQLATGRRPSDVGRVGWSSAFIAWVLHQASGGEGPAFRGPHDSNIRRAIAARRNGAEDARFVAYRPGEIAPRPGDLVCAIQSPGFSFDNPPSRFRAHCDIAVEHHPGSLDMVGGNLSDSVTLRTVRTDPRGRVLAEQRRSLDPSVHTWGLVIRIDR